MRLIISLTLMFLASTVRAQSAFYEVALGSATGPYAVSITSASGAVQVDGGIRSMAGIGRNVIEIYNDDDTDPLFCGFSVNLTTAAIGASDITNIGRRVEARKSVVYAVPEAVKIYCKATGTDAATNTAIAVISQIK